MEKEGSKISDSVKGVILSKALVFLQIARARRVCLKSANSSSVRRKRRVPIPALQYEIIVTMYNK